MLLFIDLHEKVVLSMNRRAKLAKVSGWGVAFPPCDNDVPSSAWLFLSFPSQPIIPDMLSLVEVVRYLQRQVVFLCSVQQQNH